MSDATPIVIIPVKRGWQTTEFWLAVAGNLVTVLGTLMDMVPRETAPWVFGAINVAYMISRALTKAFAVGEMLPGAGSAERQEPAHGEDSSRGR